MVVVSRGIQPIRGAACHTEKRTRDDVFGESPSIHPHSPHGANRANLKDMTQARRPISFIATTQPEKATAFYRDVLGLDLLETSPFSLVFADGAHVLRVQIVGVLEPAPFTVHGWQVACIDDEIDDLAAQGVTMSRFEHLSQDARGVWTSPSGARVCWFEDPCGNTLSLTETP